MVDILIADNQLSDAIKELKKTEKQLYDSWSYIGVYKRYIRLGEEEKAEKLIKKAIKKNSRNPELTAIYADFLIGKGSLEEAKKTASILRGTKYGSIYSEAVLKLAQKQNNSENNLQFYKDPEYYSIYYDAYSGSKNPVWLRDCAIFNLKDGLFGNAASLKPASYADADDAYFWALVCFDAGKYYDAIEAVESSKTYLEDYPDTSTRKLYKVSKIKQIALESDAYIAVSEMEAAEKYRQNLVCRLDELQNLNANDENLLAAIVVNSAIYAKNQYEDDSSADLLFYCVNRWPDYVPALILYSDFAYQSNLEIEEELEVRNLRENGITSLSMEKYDSRRRIPMSDALYRLNNSLEKTRNPYLSITKLDLKYKMDKSYTVKSKTADLWLELENNYTEEVKYQSLLVQYVLSYLLKTNQIEDAKTLFIKYMKSTYNFNEKEGFWVQLEQVLPQLDLRTAEFAAWFAADAKLPSEAIRLYEYCVYESKGVMADGNISPEVTTVSCMNLADIYYSLGNEKKALDLYGKAAGRESNNYLRSDIFYRLANVYYAEGDLKNALRSVDYATLIYPNNARAALLKERLNLK